MIMDAEGRISVAKVGQTEMYVALSRSSSSVSASACQRDTPTTVDSAMTLITPQPPVFPTALADGDLLDAGVDGRRAYISFVILGFALLVPWSGARVSSSPSVAHPSVSSLMVVTAC
jgi:hypothetical protein